ncbi:hypothetical protein D3C76_1189570 [compost metagenome]
MGRAATAIGFADDRLATAAQAGRYPTPCGTVGATDRQQAGLANAQQYPVQGIQSLCPATGQPCPRARRFAFHRRGPAGVSRARAVRLGLVGRDVRRCRQCAAAKLDARAHRPAAGLCPRMERSRRHRLLRPHHPGAAGAGRARQRVHRPQRSGQCVRPPLRPLPPDVHHLRVATERSEFLRLPVPRPARCCFQRQRG